MALAIRRYRKDPDSVLDYTIDWSDWLQTSETISTSAWTVTSGITKGSDSKTSTTTTVWLSGGTDGNAYEATNLITTSGGRTVSRTFEILVSER